MEHQWIEYSLLYLNGSGIQPYETLIPLGVRFDGGHYVENGRYRGRLSGTTDQINNALLSLAVFGVLPLSPNDILQVVERMVPTNTQRQERPDDQQPPTYLGPATLNADLEIVREHRNTPFV